MKCPKCGFEHVWFKERRVDGVMAYVNACHFCGYEEKVKQTFEDELRRAEAMEKGEDR